MRPRMAMPAAAFKFSACQTVTERDSETAEPASGNRAHWHALGGIAEALRGSRDSVLTGSVCLGAGRRAACECNLTATVARPVRYFKHTMEHDVEFAGAQCAVAASGPTGNLNPSRSLVIPHYPGAVASGGSHCRSGGRRLRLVSLKAAVDERTDQRLPGRPVY